MNKRFKILDGIIALNTYKLTVRFYDDTDKTKYRNQVLYLDDDGLYEWEVNRVPKHRLWEIVEKERLTGYEWMEGLKLRTLNYEEELKEIAACGSLEAYEASLPAAIDEYLLALETEIALMQLGISGGDLE